ncbi:DODA-type extradiol aromatic ring-opening family dioxygenase [Burkholderia territorii]|uniref:DODA-type extradiol aromatic ring-opening family dioxygenase n=1 Tax=Burkholderia territorii TaxID=1503055 RepID=UPI0009C0A655|nr:class III extradiol ring-cleavage dioxygenase [Burkholderia territorii]
MSASRLPTWFLSHGAGPWPFMAGAFRDQFATLEQALIATGGELAHARAILMVSAHWETGGFAVSSGAQPAMIYDYAGFPAETYRVRYKAPGSPLLAERVHRLLQAGGITNCRLDPDRGYDHGTFSIMKVMRPLADKPIVQLSLDRGFDPQLHFDVGVLLAPLRDEGVAIIGSGQSFQNLSLRDVRAIKPSGDFDAWLRDTLVHAPPADRRDRLLHWKDAPYARLAHPREEHLLPLMVAAGAAGDDIGECIYREQLGGVMTAASFRFGAPPLAISDSPGSAINPNFVL